MSNYSKITNFTAKDALAIGDINKRINGTLLDAEFNPIASAIATKIDKVAGEAGEIPIFTSSGGLESSNKTIVTILNAIYPVGSIYTNAAEATNPATLLGFGTWVAFGAGRVMVGLDSGDTNFDTLGETGGSKDAIVVSHNHGITDSGHTHTQDGNIGGHFSYSAGGGTAGVGFPYQANVNVTTSVTGISINSAGVSGANKNLQPYITVYMWKRTV